MAASSRWIALLLKSSALLLARSSELPAACKDATTCEAYVQNLTARLEEMRDEMRGKQLTLQALEDLRTGILSGKRVELPSAQRQHLERGSPLISEISYDVRHRPISTNLSRHFQHIRTLAPDVEVRFHTFMPLKRAASASQKVGPAALVVIVDSEAKLSMHSLDGGVVLDRFDLGHSSGSTITHLALSPSQDNHFVLTADDQGEVRVHNLKVTAKTNSKKEKKDERKEKADKAEKGDGEKSDDKGEGSAADRHGGSGAQKRQLVVTANLSASFSIPSPAVGEVRKLTAVLPIDRGSQTYFVTGDSLGGIAVFHRNGTMKGRVRVTEDHNGVRGLMRSQGQMVLFWSSHSFGFFSTTQVDVQYPPCTGWNSPLFDVAIDPSFSSSRVILALSDGDVLVFSTSRGKSKACDLTLKFPHVSAVPFRLHGFRGHVMGLPTPLEDDKRKDDYLREIFFFNLAAMDAGYGSAPSRAVALQVSFKPRQPEQLALFAASSGSGGDRAKSQIALRFAGSPGLELYDLSLKTPAPSKAAGGGGSGGGGGDDSWSASNWLNWFPKIGVFGIALVGVVMWNIRKVTSQRAQDHDRHSGFDDEFFKERLRERRERDKGGEGRREDAGGLGGLGGLGSEDD